MQDLSKLKRKINFFFILLIIFMLVLPIAYSFGGWRYLTKGLADRLYCKIGGNCNLTSLEVINLTVTGNFTSVNTTYVDYNVTGDMDVSGNLDVGGNITFGGNIYGNGSHLFDLNVTHPNETDPHWSSNYTNMLDDCPGGNYVYGMEGNGTWKCREDLINGTGGTGGGYPDYNNTYYLNIENNINEAVTLNFSGVSQTDYTYKIRPTRHYVIADEMQKDKEGGGGGGTSDGTGGWTNDSDYTYTDLDVTLGEKITFSLGEIIDNIVDGWIQITGNLKVVGSTNITESLTISPNITAITCNEGTIYYDGDLKKHMGCNGTWNELY